MQNDNERACQTVKYCLAGFVRQRGIPPPIHGQSANWTSENFHPEGLKMVLLH